MRKRVLKFWGIMLLLVCITSNVYASTNKSLFEFGAFENIYKLSEQTEDIKLPFFNMFLSSATYDKDVKHSGISFGQSTVEVGEKLEGLHIIFTQDMVTIKGEVEHAIIYGNNIVVEGKISGDTILIAPKVQIMETAVVSRDVIIVADELSIKGNVQGNVIAAISNTANISGDIQKDLRIIATKISLENAKIQGEVYVETDTKESDITDLYPNATVLALAQEKEEPKLDVMAVVSKGIITVVVYTVLCMIITKKENNVAYKAYEKIKEHTIYGIFMSLGAFMLVIILPIILILLAVCGLGIIAWPILIAYLALILLSVSTASLVVGTTIYAGIKNKVKKYKWLVVAGIFIVLFALTQIPVISYYSLVAINLISLAIIITMITRKIKEDKKAVK